MSRREILMIEDDPDVVSVVTTALRGELDCNIQHCTDGASGLAAALTGAHSLLIIDVNLPGVTGMDICRKLRESGLHMPVLVLTGRGGELDRILGLELGGDDYVTKPFSPREVVARIRALLRRAELRQAPAGARETLHDGPLTVDFFRRIALVDGVDLKFTASEFDLFAYLAIHPGQTISRERLMTEVLGYTSGGYDDTVTTHMSRMRSKLEASGSRHGFLRTVRGIGYCFVPSEKSND